MSLWELKEDEIRQYREWFRNVPKRIQEKARSINRYLIESYEETLEFDYYAGPSEVVHDFLFLGSSTDGKDIVMQETKQIKHVLSLCNLQEGKTKESFPEGHSFLGLNAMDNELYDISQHFHACFDFINNAKKLNERILVHCQAGVSRSSTIVCAYLMLENGWSVEESIKFVKSKRWIVEPNQGFILRLLFFEEKLSVQRQAAS